ncbi:MAG TPA: D-alanyl-D-alanine carboxypeptidase/D-alanyl-D-alanine-endopeptidase [Rhodocyclaceae bacterium]|nr:D-alanyl-D-alanine carboxypeptidase/D-alanyl-D-alanine-endopeptidase [Rhodocyclaceae bacterium]
MPGIRHVPYLRVLVAISLYLALIVARAADLPRSVEQALTRAGIPVADTAIWVQGVDARQPSLAINAHRPMNPASVMKLVTAFAALEHFGPAYSWTTRISTSGRVEGGILQGDLHLTGGGDPVLSYERLWKLLRRVRTLGIEHVRGDIVMDGSALRLPQHDPFAFDGRGLRPYNSGPHGLLVHFNTLQFFLEPASAAEAPVGFMSTPPIHGLSIDNRIVTGSGPCGVWHRNLDTSVELTPSGPRLVLLGHLPASCGPRTWSAAPLSPEQFGAAIVAALWSEVGGTYTGSVRPGTTPADATVVLTDASPALAEVLREMNKWSSNVIARQLLATLGATDLASHDMMRSGAAVAAAQLEAAGIDTRGLVIENGSGLSRIERIRADTLGGLLLTAWRRPFMPEFIAAMPLAGVDGTAHQRLGRSPARGQAHIKTGTINHVRAMAGYVHDRNGHRHAVVMMVNHPSAAESQAAQDALLEWIWAAN